MPENAPAEIVPLPALPSTRRLWRAKFADSLDNPRISSVVLIRGAQSLFDAGTKAKSTEGWKNFLKAYPSAEIVGVEYAGRLEN